MSPRRIAQPKMFRRTRPHRPSCRGGASSLLRLKVSAAQRLPSAGELSDWMSQAAVDLMPVTGPHFDFLPSTFHIAGTR